MYAFVFLCFKGSPASIATTVNFNSCNPVGITKALAFPVIFKSAKKSQDQKNVRIAALDILCQHSFCRFGEQGSKERRSVA